MTVAFRRRCFAGPPLVAVAMMLVLACTGARADPWQDALALANAGVAEARKANDAQRLAEALARRAGALQQLGDRQRALTDAEEAAATLPAGAPTALRAAVSGVHGQALLLSGSAERAQIPLRAALALAEPAGLQRLSAAAGNDLGLALARLQRLGEAEAAFAAAQAAALRGGDALTASRVALNRARLAERSQDPARAREQARAADALLAPLADSREVALQRAGAGDLLRRQAGNQNLVRREAEAALEGAAASAARLRDPYASAYALVYLAELALDEQRLAQAAKFNERAQFAAQASGQANVVFRAQWQSARLLDRAGEPDAALAAYRSALVSLDSIKADIAAEVWSAGDSYRERVGGAYFGFVDLLLRRAGKDADAARATATLREARAVLERFRTVELEDYFRDDCVERYLAGVKPLEQAAARTAVLYPIPLPDRLELLVSIGERMHRVVVPVGEDALRREALALRVALERRATFQFLPHARQLHDWLIRPLEALLAEAQVDTLVLVPDGPLRGMALAALHDGKGFLIERYALAIAPSLSLVDPRPLAARATSILAAGVAQSVQGFSALPAVTAELADLQALGAKSVLLDSAFSAAAFEQGLRNAPVSVVHIASHARFSADARESFLLTWDGRITLDQVERQFRATRLRDEPIELLFLSACETAAGDERAALGLAGVAVKAGARSAVATLWQVNDAATGLLVSEFYRQLATPGVSKAEALRRAQRALLADLRYRHPGQWSAFMIIGNWL
jgi:CHAT domain-containing protein